MRTLRIGVAVLILAVHAGLAPVGSRSTVRTAAGAEADGQSAEDAAADSGERDPRLTLKQIQGMRRQRMTPEQVADSVAERGRDFEVTADAIKELRSLGFRPAQIDAIKEASDEAIVPGKWLTLSDNRRAQILKDLKQVVVKSGAAIEPIESQHMTLWASKKNQRTYLPDVQKLEKFFRTKCGEPIRSGLDKRSAHVVLLKDHDEYEAWWRAMFELFGERFHQNDNPNANAHYREEVIKIPVYFSWEFCAVSTEESPDWVHRHVAGGVGNMYFAQLSTPGRSSSPLQTGFVDGVETAVFGYPTIMFCTIVYGEQNRNPGKDRQAWNLLVRQRMATRQATPMGELLQMDSSKMEHPHYAEAWTLVGLLNKQPGKFGKLMLALREGVPELEAIEKVYGWDEKKLTQQWRTYVLGQK